MVNYRCLDHEPITHWLTKHRLDGRTIAVPTSEIKIKGREDLDRVDEMTIELTKDESV